MEEDKRTRSIRTREHVKDMMATREYYKDRKLKREEIVALEFLKKAVRELYIEQEDRNKAKVHVFQFKTPVFVTFPVSRTLFKNKMSFHFYYFLCSNVSKK